jgi:ribosomal RNA-processing protein 12
MLGSAVAAMGPKNVLEILEIHSICNENGWILPVLEKHIVGTSLQFFLKDILDIVKAVEKSISKVYAFIETSLCFTEKKDFLLLLCFDI